MRVGWTSRLVVLLLSLGAQGAFAHGGGLDAYGCHHNRKAGGYHCHRGPLAGQAFGSQGEMLQTLGREEKAAPAQVPGVRPPHAAEPACPEGTELLYRKDAVGRLTPVCK